MYLLMTFSSRFCDENSQFCQTNHKYEIKHYFAINLHGRCVLDPDIKFELEPPVSNIQNCLYFCAHDSRDIPKRESDRDGQLKTEILNCQSKLCLSQVFIIPVWPCVCPHERDIDDPNRETDRQWQKETDMLDFQTPICFSQVPLVFNIPI